MDFILTEEQRQLQDAVSRFMTREYTFDRRRAILKSVDGCSTGTIVYDATYAIPSQNFNLHLIINVTYTFKHGKWLSVIDQGTEIPA